MFVKKGHDNEMVSFHNAIRVLQDPIKKLKIITNAFCSTSVFCTYKKDSFNQKTNSTCMQAEYRQGMGSKKIGKKYFQNETAWPRSQFLYIHVHVSVSDFYIPKIGSQTQYSKIGLGIYKELTDT
jgi:hypothetical protein